MRTIVRNMGTMVKAPIDWLFPQVRKKVLALLLGAPEERWYLRDIARRTGCAVTAVKRELAGLAAAEIIHSAKDGNRVYYQANKECGIFPDLSGLMRKTAGLADVLRSALSVLGGKIELAFVYGSQASGTARAASDIDLLVVGDMDEMLLHRAVGQAEEQLNRTVNYTLMSQAEFRMKAKDKRGFLGRVLAAPRIAVIGSLDEIR